MSYYLNKIVGALLNPLMIGLVPMLAGFLLLALRPARRRAAVAVFAAGAAWLWFWSAGLTSGLLGLSLERAYPAQTVEDTPAADAIVLLGGGMGPSTNGCPYANLFAAGDRVWHAARLYHAGKAPRIIPTGTGCDAAELPFLLDLGVPRDAILLEDAARNTEENARYVAGLLKRPDGVRPKVLLVTSALHMRRALFLYRRYAPGLDVLPAGTDYELTAAATHPFTPAALLPGAQALSDASYAFKEWLGYWGYRLLRR